MNSQVQFYLQKMRDPAWISTGYWRVKDPEGNLYCIAGDGYLGYRRAKTIVEFRKGYTFENSGKRKPEGE